MNNFPKKAYYIFILATLTCAGCNAMEKQLPILPRVIEKKPKIYRMPSGTVVGLSPKGTVRKRSASGELTTYNTDNIVKVTAAYPILHNGKIVYPRYYYSDFTVENSSLESKSVVKALKKAKKNTEKKPATPGNQ